MALRKPRAIRQKMAQMMALTRDDFEGENALETVDKMLDRPMQILQQIQERRDNKNERLNAGRAHLVKAAASKIAKFDANRMRRYAKARDIELPSGWSRKPTEEKRALLANLIIDHAKRRHGITSDTEMSVQQIEDAVRFLDSEKPPAEADDEHETRIDQSTTEPGQTDAA